MDALQGIGVGDEIILITWLHEADRDVLQVHPRNDTGRQVKSGVGMSRRVEAELTAAGSPDRRSKSRRVRPRRPASR